MFTGGASIRRVLEALGERLSHHNDPHTELVVCGGAALNALGLSIRATRDVDALAMASREPGGELILHPIKAFPVYLQEHVQAMVKDFALTPDWLNLGPADLVESLPEGLVERLESEQYGDRLVVHFISRLDQVHFKFYAAVYTDIGRHFADLQDLNPTPAELESAARWSLTHDASEPFKLLLREMLTYMGHADIAARI